jgi:hypothetical protein
MVKFEIEVSRNQGLKLSGHMSMAALRAVLTIALGAASIPWLSATLHALGLM